MLGVRLEGLRKSFSGNPIVKGVNLDVSPGEFMVLVGPSGCGKTTLLRLIAGLEQPDAGDLFFGDRRVNEVPPRERDVGLVFQSYALYPHMTVRENLAFGLKLRGLPAVDIDSKVKDAATLLELSELLERKPKNLSGGQRQRVAMGRVIVRRPKLFLFDEPLSNLDTALRVQMRGELSRLHQKLGVTMIYVTHDQVEAMTLATRVAVFNEGHLQQVGTPLELYNRPANTFVAGFLGSPSMNILPAQANTGAVTGIGFQLSVPGLAASGEVRVGVRPQDLRVAGDGPFAGVIAAVERLGFDGYAYVTTDAGPVAARFEGDLPVRVGERVRVKPVGNVAHVFSADGARALCHPERV